MSLRIMILPLLLNIRHLLFFFLVSRVVFRKLRPNYKAFLRPQHAGPLLAY